MKTQRIALFISLATMTASALSDVTVTQTTSGNASFINVGGEGRVQIKGNRQRSEQSVKGRELISIIDVDGRRFIDIDDKKKTAQVTPLESVGEALQKAGVGALQVSLTKTSQKRTVASYSCTEHNIAISVPFSPAGGSGSGLDMTLVLAGTACLSSDAPGFADYKSFYKAAGDSGFIFGDPRSAKSPTGAAQAKAYAELAKKMAEAGIPLETQINITAKGDGPLAGMMAKLAASDIHTTVTKIEAGEVSADKFDVPAGYKVKTQK